MLKLTRMKLPCGTSTKRCQGYSSKLGRTNFDTAENDTDTAENDLGGVQVHDSTQS